MKKIISILVVTVLLAAVFGTSVSAADSANITVTIADGNGSIAVALEAMTVTDADNDGQLTVNDAFITAHDTWYEGGATAGYASETTQWGLSVKKFWGVENGGSYGYYVNNAMAMGLTDPIKDGDYLAAFVYVDTQGLSDAYSYIEETTDAEPSVGKAAFRASFSGWDENWNPLISPIVGANVYLDGNDAGIVTGANGEFVVQFPGNGVHTITVRSADRNYACAVYKFTVVGMTEKVENEEPKNDAAQTPETPANDASANNAPAAQDAPADDAAQNAPENNDAANDGATNTSVRSPKTGDTSVAVLALLAISLCACAFTFSGRRRED